MKDYNEGIEYFNKIRRKVRGRFSSYTSGHTCPRICDIEYIFERYDIKIIESTIYKATGGGLHKYINARVLAYKLKHSSYWMINERVRLDLPIN